MKCLSLWILPFCLHHLVKPYHNAWFVGQVLTHRWAAGDTNPLFCVFQPAAVCRSTVWVSAEEVQDAWVHCRWSASSESSSSEEVWPGPSCSLGEHILGSVTSTLVWQSSWNITQVWGSIALLPHFGSSLLYLQSHVPYPLLPLACFFSLFFSIPSPALIWETA